MDVALERALQPSAVHMYVCRVMSRALSRSAVEDPVELDTVARESMTMSRSEVETLMQPVDAEVSRRCGDEEMMVADKEDEPEDWIVFEGDWNVVSEFRTIAAERSYSYEGPPPDSDCNTASGRFEKLVRSKVGEVGDKIVGTVEKMGSKIGTITPVLSGTWDSIDEAGERYAQQIEELVKLKASMISHKSRSTYQDVCSTAEKCSWQLEGTAALAVDKSKVVCQDVESKLVQYGAVDYVNKLEGCIQNGALLMSRKALAVSKAARMKTGDLPSYYNKYDAMRRGMKSAVQKGFKSARGCEPSN